ncbi:MAG: GUN4 domain-containing protein [Cyanobacteria bacterium J06555_13]
MGSTIRVEGTQLLELVSEALVEQEEALTATAFLEPVVEVSELIVQQEDEYEFAHLSFQEYLAAAHVAAGAAREELLYEHVTEDWWKPMLLLYSGLVNPTKLIREAISQGANDVAYDCLQETRKRIDEGLKASLQAARTQAAVDELSELDSVTEQVQVARYADLMRYLGNGEWQEADHETYCLMITEVGKEDGQFFDTEDLINFPRKPLTIIDRLWAECSDGKFGFSVRKKMYLECGGNLDEKYVERVWDKFFQTNGWQVNKKWTDPKFDITSPKGHLPAIFFDYYEGRIGDEIFALLSHPDL